MAPASRNGAVPFAQRVRGQLAALRPSEQRVVEHLLAIDPFSAAARAGAVASALGVSQATVVNAAQRLGYAGFADFRRHLIAEQAVERARQVVEAVPDSQEALPPADPLLDICRRVFDESQAVLAATGRHWASQPFGLAVEVLAVAPQVLCIGSGWSGVLARLAAGTFTQYGIRATGQELAI